jgi:hypothetical protein
MIWGRWPRRTGNLCGASPLRWLLAAAVVAVVAAGPGAKPASAHVEIDVGNGKYAMSIGFRDEPTYVGQPNALSLIVQEYGTGGAKPVEGLADTLNVRVIKGDQSMPLTLVPQGGGNYEGVFVPTETGDYTFHISGTMGDQTVDQTVTSGPTTFDSVQPLTAIEFPRPLPDSAQVAQAAADAEAAAATARMLGVAGLVAGLLGLVVAAVALARAGRPKVEPVARTSEPTGKLIR